LPLWKPAPREALISSSKCSPSPAAKPVEPATPAVAKTPATTATDTANIDSEVIKTVNSWAKAWSGNDVKGYLSFYAPNFQTPGGEPRADWEAERKIRVAKPKKIDVRIESPKVTVTDSNRVAVTFRQSYRSPTLKASSTKTLILVKAGDRWLIQQERIGS
jgi:murein L,D-transpeptidase YafK